MNELIFLYPAYFFLLLPTSIFFLFLYKRTKKVSFFGSLEDLKKIYGHNNYFLWLYYGVLFLIFFLFICIFANLVVKTQKTDIKKNGVDINIVLDVSYSMLASDIEPNRLEASKSIIADFIDQLEADRVGVTVFAGKPFVSLPLNFDYDLTKKIIGRISEETIQQRNFSMQGTALGDALLLAGESFDREDDREKIIILLTDGEANKGVDPLIAMKYLNDTFQTGIRIYTIGIGGDENTYVELKDDFGNTYRTPVAALDEKTLRSIARDASGKYFRAVDNTTFQKIFDTIALLEKKDIESESFTVHSEKNTIFVFLLLLLFSGLLWLIVYKKI